MRATYEMTLAQKTRRRRENRFHPHSGECEKGSDVVLAGRRQPHDLRIDKLFPGELALGQKPPDSRMKPEHRCHDFFNYGNERVSPSHMKQFVTRDSVLPCGTQSQKGFRQQNNRSKDANRCRASHFR
jgi:hypothetical protein